MNEPSYEELREQYDAATQQHDLLLYDLRDAKERIKELEAEIEDQKRRKRYFFGKRGEALRKIEAVERELEIARDTRNALEQCLFDGPVPDDGSLIYERAIQLRKIEEAARAYMEQGGEENMRKLYEAL